MKLAKKTVTIRVAAPFAKKSVDHAVEGARLAETLFSKVSGGTVDHMLLRILGLMAAQPSHVTSETCKERIRALQTELVARMWRTKSRG